MRKPATCHPEKQQHAFGLCNACYNKSKGYGSRRGPRGKLTEQRAREEAERVAWRAEDVKRAGGYTSKDEEIVQVMYEDITRGHGYRRYMGRWASNDDATL